MRILIVLFAIMFVSPAIACEGFQNTMGALESAMNIEQPKQTPKPLTKEQLAAELRSISKDIEAAQEKTKTPKQPPVTPRNTL